MFLEPRFYSLSPKQHSLLQGLSPGSWDVFLALEPLIPVSDTLLQGWAPGLQGSSPKLPCSQGPDLRSQKEFLVHLLG